MALTKRWVLVALVAVGFSGCAALRDDSNDALSALSKGDYQRAEFLGNSAFRHNPKDPYAILALAVVYQNTNRQDLARQYYAVLVSMHSQETAMTGMGPTAQRRTISEIAQDNLAALNARPTGPLYQDGMSAPAQLVVPPPPASSLAGQVAAENDNIIVRFQTLRRLLDEGLITREEYDQRRGANLAALLRYTVSQRPGRGLERPAPDPEQVVQRLRALAAGYLDRSISAAEQMAERSVILDNLLPPLSARRADKAAPVTTQMQAAAAVGLLERMREANVITAAEQGREKQAVFASVDAYEAQAAATQRLAAGMPMPEVKPTGPGVQLGTAKTEAQARSLWESLQNRFPDQLGNLQPAIKKVSLRRRGTSYTLGAGPLADKKAATALCKVLRAAKQSCVPVTLR